MGNKSSNSHDIDKRCVSSGAGMRTGIAKDKLIFIIICVVAMTVAAVTLVHTFSGGVKVAPSLWQCADEDCAKKSTTKGGIATAECPKCGGKAHRLGYRVCPACDKKVLYCRMELPEGAAGPDGGSPRLPIGGRQVVYLQYWVKQEDGSFGWSSHWMLAGSPEAMEIYRKLVCHECGAGLIKPRGAGR